jgi:hypothetical protein
MCRFVKELNHTVLAIVCGAVLAVMTSTGSNKAEVPSVDRGQFSPHTCDSF